jgi:hypothetical protein
MNTIRDAVVLSNAHAAQTIPHPETSRKKPIGLKNAGETFGRGVIKSSEYTPPGGAPVGALFEIFESDK